MRPALPRSLAASDHRHNWMNVLKRFETDTEERSDREDPGPHAGGQDSAPQLSLRGLSVQLWHRCDSSVFNGISITALMPCRPARSRRDSAAIKGL